MKLLEKFNNEFQSLLYWIILSDKNGKTVNIDVDYKYSFNPYYIGLSFRIAEETIEEGLIIKWFQSLLYWIILSDNEVYTV